MKNLYAKFGIGLFVLAVLAGPFAAGARTPIGNSLDGGATAVETTSATAAGLTSASDIPTLVGRGVSVVLGLLGIIFVVLVVYAGFLYLTSNGEEANVKKAKKMLTQAVIGMVLVASAYAISSYVIDALRAVSKT